MCFTVIFAAIHVNTINDILTLYNLLLKFCTLLLCPFRINMNTVNEAQNLILKKLEEYGRYYVYIMLFADVVKDFK